MMRRGFAVLLAIAVFLEGCATVAPLPPPPPPPVMRPLPPPPPPPMPSIRPRPVPLENANYTRVPVFYATNRARLSATALEGRFSNASGSGVIYGALDVTVPLVHEEGEVERPGIFYGLFFDPDPAKHFTIAYNSELGRAAFFARVRESLRYKAVTGAGGRRKQALVFVHGFNVAFDDAAFRTAQISHDMKFRGTPLFYSWPSANSLFSYTGDASRIEESRGYIKAFFADVATQTGADDIYIIAHSMGTRGVSEALKELALEKPALAGRFRALILAAPDINKKVFVDQIAPTLRRFIPNTTVYASALDKALLLSSGIAAADRLGDTSGGVALVRGVSSIDASAAKMSILGHSEYGDSPALLRDMAGVIAGRAPAQRPGLRRRNAAPLPYYVLAP